MSPRSQLVERVRRWRGWLIPAALLALAPKCLVCVLGYAGLGAALGLGGPELCGDTEAPSAGWAGWLLPLGAGALLGLFVARVSRPVVRVPHGPGDPCHFQSWGKGRAQRNCSVCAPERRATV